MIAVLIDFFCELHVRRRPAASSADLPEDGPAEPDIDHGQTFTDSHPCPGRIFFLQTYEFQWKLAFHPSFLSYHVFRRGELHRTEFRDTLQSQKDSAAQDTF